MSMRLPGLFQAVVGPGRAGLCLRLVPGHGWDLAVGQCCAGGS